MDKNGIKLHEDLLCTITICTFASEKKKYRLLALVRAVKDCIHIRITNLVLKRLGIKG
jgi:hypothetical protein